MAAPEASGAAILRVWANWSEQVAPQHFWMTKDINMFDITMTDKARPRRTLRELKFGALAQLNHALRQGCSFAVL
jgi:hypothetical protein